MSTPTFNPIIGPVLGGARGWSFGSSSQDLTALGYVEEEYFLEGEAAQFSLAPGSKYERDGCWDVVTREPSPFRTRFIVRRPVDPDRFSGMVVLCWNNVSMGFEFLGRMSKEILASGAAWVGASVQSVGIDGFPGAEDRGLRGWDGDRYGDLSISDDDASFDIFTQIAHAVGPDRLTTSVGEDRGVDPMGGLPVNRLIAMGESQSACRLATYYNAIQPVSQRFDGFLLVVYSGGGTRVEAKGPGPSLEAIPAEFRDIINVLPFGYHRLRIDLPVPVFVVNSETEAPWFWSSRQPDTAIHRFWEIAGAAHSGGAFPEEIEAIWLRDLGEVPSILGPPPEFPNTLSYEPVVDAALHHLWTWVKDGTVPPQQDRLLFAGDPLELIRDGYGNATGGIRVPDFAVPTATHRGASGGELPDLVGSSIPFAAERLRALYPDHAAYMVQYDDAVRDGVARGFLLEADAPRLRALAATALVP